LNAGELQRFGDTRLAVHRMGEGVPLVWGHSLMGSMWVEDLTGLFDWGRVARRVHLVRYDARGHGGSEGGEAPDDYTWERMAGDMLNVADWAAAGTGARQVILGGISMGAATALEAAVQRPDQVAGLVLALPPTAWETRPRQAAIYRRMSWFSGLLGAAPYRLLDWLPSPVRDDGLSRLAMATVKGLAKSDPRTVQSVLQGAAASDMPARSVLRELRVPTLILAWTDDRAHPVSTARALADHLPDVRGFDIASPREPPDWSRQICEFVDGLRIRPHPRGKRKSRRGRST
jgi:pimeloyl-ACP methyl ester carboxylesterase